MEIIASLSFVGRYRRSTIAMALVLALSDLPLVSAQSVGTSQVTVSEIAPRFHLLSEPTANMLVFVGEEASFVAGIHTPSLLSTALETISALGAPPIRYALILDGDRALRYDAAAWGRRDVLTIAHERTRRRIERSSRRENTGSATPGQTVRPTFGFSEVVQLDLSAGEDVHLVHARSGYTDADVIVHFETAGIVFLGHTFTTDGYPVIDIDRGGSLLGMIKTAEYFSDGSWESHRVEPIVPGRGRVATVQDLREFAEMLVAVRDSVQTLLEEGKTLEEVIAAKPTAQFDYRWAGGPVTPDQFVGMVYTVLTKR